MDDEAKQLLREIRDHLGTMHAEQVAYAEESRKNFRLWKKLVSIILLPIILLLFIYVVWGFLAAITARPEGAPTQPVSTEY